jgi:hypothetical protein
LAFRNHTPGALLDGPFARSHGAIRKDNRKFAVFPTPESGMNALTEKLRANGEMLPEQYIAGVHAQKDNGTIPLLKGNDPKAYAKELRKSGVRLDRPIKEQIGNMAEGIYTVEGRRGWTVWKKKPGSG